MRALESKDGMQRISTVLKTSEAMAVRKAVCMAGAECVVIMPMPLSVPSEAHVRLEVTAKDLHHDGIVSAIQRVAQVGSVVFDSHLDMLPLHAA